MRNLCRQPVSRCRRRSPANIATDRRRSNQPIRPIERIRIGLALLLFAIGMLSAAGPARAQTYDPNYPVCLQVFGLISYYDCRYTSMPQCAVSAQARAAQCIVNPYYAGALHGAPPRRH
jgi:Protein of unknown function (DUF3551)